MNLSFPLGIGILISILMALIGALSTIESTLVPKWRAVPLYSNADIISKDCQVTRGGWVEGDTPESVIAKPKTYDPVPVPLSITTDNGYTANRAVNAYFYFRCLIDSSRFKQTPVSPYVFLGPLYGKIGWVFVNGEKMASYEQKVYYGFFVKDTSKPLLIEIIALPRNSAIYAGMGSIIEPAIYFNYRDYQKFMEELLIANSFYAQVISGILLPICMLFWIMFIRGFRYHDIYWFAIGLSLQLFSYGIERFIEYVPGLFAPFLVDLSTRLAQICMILFGYHFLRLKSRPFIIKTVLGGTAILAFVASTALVLKYMPVRIPHFVFSGISITFFAFFFGKSIVTINHRSIPIRRKINLGIFATVSLVYIAVIISDLTLILSLDNKLWLGLLLCDFFFAAATFIEIMDRQKTHAKEQESFGRREVEHQILETQLSLGKTVQKLLLPKDLSGRHGVFSYRFHYSPSQSMSGDWITEWKDPSGTEHLILGDVVGKGPQAAIAVTAIMSVIHKAKSQTQPISDILQDIHQFLGSLFDYHITSTVTAVSLHSDGTATLINCGGQGWFHVAGEDTKAIPLRGNLLGGHTPFLNELQTMTLKNGEHLLTFTDGVIDGSRSVMKLIRTLKPKSSANYSSENLIELAIQVGRDSVYSDDKAALVISKIAPDD